MRRLEASVGEVFKAPRNRLSRTVGKVTCTRLCASSERSAADLVRTRAAAKAAAAAAAGSASPLVPMRACMSYQDKLPARCVDASGRECGDAGGIVVAAVARDNSRGGKGLDVVWIIVVPAAIPTRMPSVEEGDTGDGGRGLVQVTGVRPPPGFYVRQVAFYGSVPGVQTQNEGRLAIVLEPIGERDRAAGLHLIALDDLNFTAVGTLASFGDQGVLSPARKAKGGAGTKEVVGTARAEGAEALLLAEMSGRSRELPQHIHGVAVALSGARGMACAVSSSKHLIVFDLEEDEEDEGEEEDGEEE